MSSHNKKETTHSHLSNDRSNRWRSYEISQFFQIVAIFIAACIETDIYLPAFPDMMKAFHVTEAEIQGVLTWNFLGLCLSGPIYGPISDAYGRRKPLLFALGMFLLGSLITVFSEGFSGLIIGRVLQGLGSGGCFTLGSAIIFDAFSMQKAMVALNYMNTLVPTTMALAPMVGGFLNKNFGFRSNFLAITLVVLVSWVVSLLKFKETLPEVQRHPVQAKKLKRDFARVLGSFSFWQMNLPVCLLFGGYLGFLSVSSVYFMVELEVPKATYPYFQSAVLGGFLAASLCCTWFLKRWGARKTKHVGMWTLGLSMVGFELAYLFAPRNPLWLTLPMITYSFGYNWIQTPYFGEIMALMPDIKGVVGSLVTSFRLLLTAGFVGAVGYFYQQGMGSFAVGQLIVALIVVPMMWLRETDPASKTELSDKPEVHVSH